jgi:hypothetical protein
MLATSTNNNNTNPNSTPFEISANVNDAVFEGNVTGAERVFISGAIFLLFHNL